MKKQLQRALAAIGVTIALIAGTVVVVAPAQAADGSNFDAGMIISDETFYNSAAMNTGQVQAFLNDKGSGCRANSLQCVKDITLSYPGRAGDQYCNALPAGTNVRAADVFVAVAVACGVNPQVLLVLVEKEQSLVSRTSPTDYSYRYATGFACPDSGGCDDALSGFVTQVYLAAKQFERYRINPGSYNYRAGTNNNILYNPDPSCGSSSVFIRNQATAGLYNYTPYQPNASALANLYGEGDRCGSYGNRNFWRMFTDWFGGDTNTLAYSGFEGGVGGWGFPNGAVARQLAGPSANGPQSGQYFLSLYTPKAGLSIAQDVRIVPQVRDTWTASVWVKSASVGVPYRGALTLWAMGGNQEVAQKVFSVGNTWTQVQISLPIQNGGHSQLRFEIYLDSTDAMLWMDSADLRKGAGVQPTAPIELNQPSFEGGIGTWGRMNGAANLARYQFNEGSHEGTWVVATNAPASGYSIGQNITAVAGRGESYTASIWLRASDAAGTFSGALALWGLGSGADLGVTPFTVGTTWTQVTTTMTVAQPSTTSLRFELYLGSTTGDLYLDDASLVPNLLPNPSFETDASSWNNGLMQGVVELASGADGVLAVDGKKFAVTNAGFTGGSIASDVARTMATGETYTGSIWLRTVTPGTTWNGTLALWALGGANEVGASAITVTDVWTKYTVQVPIASGPHNNLRFELYNQSPGVQLYLDGASIR